MKMCNILIFKQKKVNILFWFGSGFLKSKSDKSFTEIQSPIHVHYKNLPQHPIPPKGNGANTENINIQTQNTNSQL